MLENTKAYSSFSVNNLDMAKKFYAETLGLNLTEQNLPGCGQQLILHLAGGGEVLIYAKPDHVPATFTVLNFPLKNISEAVKTLSSKGIRFEKYEGTDEAGITHNEGPLIAWFKDPAGNFLSVLEEEQLSMKEDLKLTKFIPENVEEVFRCFSVAELVEKWSSPDGMSLKVPKFEAWVGGRYRYEHTSKEGLYVCHGFFKEYVPNKRLVTVDEVINPQGKVIFKNLKSVIDFREVAGGTEISLVQSGFPDESSLKECEEAWGQCIDKLNRLVMGSEMLSKMNLKGDPGQLSKSN